MVLTVMAVSWKRKLIKFLTVLYLVRPELGNRESDFELFSEDGIAQMELICCGCLKHGDRVHMFCYIWLKCFLGSPLFQTFLKPSTFKTQLVTIKIAKKLCLINTCTASCKLDVGGISFKTMTEKVSIASE